MEDNSYRLGCAQIQQQEGYTARWLSSHKQLGAWGERQPAWSRRHGSKGLLTQQSPRQDGHRKRDARVRCAYWTDPGGAGPAFDQVGLSAPIDLLYRQLACKQGTIMYTDNVVRAMLVGSFM